MVWYTAWPTGRNPGSLLASGKRLVSFQDSFVWNIFSKSLVWLWSETTEKPISLKHGVYCECSTAKNLAKWIGREILGEKGPMVRDNLMSIFFSVFFCIRHGLMMAMHFHPCLHSCGIPILVFLVYMISWLLAGCVLYYKIQIQSQRYREQKLFWCK